MCALAATRSDHAYCWRELYDGLQSQALANVSEPVEVDSSSAWRSLSVGHYVNSSTGAADSFACGIRSDGSASCWGSDFSGLGLLGAGEPESSASPPQSSATPLPLAEPGPWRSISAGHGVACGVKADDSSAWCW